MTCRRKTKTQATRPAAFPGMSCPTALPLGGAAPPQLAPANQPVSQPAASQSAKRPALASQQWRQTVRPRLTDDLRLLHQCSGPAQTLSRFSLGRQLQGKKTAPGCWEKMRVALRCHPSSSAGHGHRVAAYSLMQPDGPGVHSTPHLPLCSL